jgi:hypothetical protein
LRNLFNARAANNAGVFYGAVDQTDNIKAAEAAVAAATSVVGPDGKGGILPSNGIQAGDSSMFPTGVNLSFRDAPNLAEVKWDSKKFSFDGAVTNSGGPANPYTPDVSSPGPGKTLGIDKDVDPKITVADVKSDSYIPGAPGTGTTSPDTTSTNIGSAPIGKPLQMGKSSV